MSEPFPCPSCGASDWRAWYDQPANQGVDLIIGDDGEPEPDEYHGDESTDGDAGDNLAYECQECNYVIAPDGKPYEDKIEEEEENPA